MATRPEFAAYVAEQLGGEEAGIRLRRMFGEYGLYGWDQFFAVVCDDALFLKPTAAARALLEARGELVEAPAYVGAGLSFRIDCIEDREFLWQLRDATLRELPPPRSRKAKGSA